MALYVDSYKTNLQPIFTVGVWLLKVRVLDCRPEDLGSVHSSVPEFLHYLGPISESLCISFKMYKMGIIALFCLYDTL